ncbi:hypothetical protein C5S31_07880 [ANME-1 cluster archaeon GoMg2]|nr:hypothetical protein [ANME-1 cluster archaeon GoMg2]
MQVGCYLWLLDNCGTASIAYNNRGVSYHKLESYRKAKRDYTKAIEFDPNFGIAHTSIGDLLYTIEEDYDNAEREYREALKINEDRGYAHNGLGLVLTKRKAYKEAIAEFKKALKLKKAADFYNNLGCAHAEYGKGSAISLISFLNAQNNFKKATQGRNTYVEAHKNLTSVGELFINELKIFLLRIFIILFVFVLSIELFGLSKDNWLEITLILTGVVILGIVLFSDFMKIRIKSLGIPGVVEVEFEYEKPKARKEAFQFADPDQSFELVETEEATI